jgi:hypothetical protein
MMSIGAILRRGEIQHPAVVKIEAYSKQGDENKGKL